MHTSAYTATRRKKLLSPEEKSLTLSNIYAGAGKGDEAEWSERSISCLFILGEGSLIHKTASL